MKRLIAILAVAAAIFSSVESSARSGIIGGFTSSSTNLGSSWKNLIDAKSVSLYHVGLTYQLQLPMGLSIQPSLLYQVKGTTLDVLKAEQNLTVGDVDLRAGYLEVPVAIQWGPDLVVARPYVFLEPFIGYRLTGNAKSDFASISDDWAKKNLSKVEFGIGIGAGVELIQHLQVSLQWFANIGPIVDKDASAITGAMANALEAKSFNGVKISAAYLF